MTYEQLCPIIPNSFLVVWTAILWQEGAHCSAIGTGPAHADNFHPTNTFQNSKQKKHFHGLQMFVSEEEKTLINLSTLFKNRGTN